jgi:hypothetical protein
MKPKEFIINYLDGKDFTSPSDIGAAYGEFKHGLHHCKTGYHSALASPKCLKLVKQGILKRDHRGWYRLEQDIHNSN